MSKPSRSLALMPGEDNSTTLTYWEDLFLCKSALLELQLDRVRAIRGTLLLSFYNLCRFLPKPSPVRRPKAHYPRISWKLGYYREKVHTRPYQWSSTFPYRASLRSNNWASSSNLTRKDYRFCLVVQLRQLILQGSSNHQDSLALCLGVKAFQ